MGSLKLQSSQSSFEFLQWHIGSFQERWYILISPRSCKFKRKIYNRQDLIISGSFRYFVYLKVWAVIHAIWTPACLMARGLLNYSLGTFALRSINCYFQYSMSKVHFLNSILNCGVVYQNNAIFEKCCNSATSTEGQRISIAKTYCIYLCYII